MIEDIVLTAKDFDDKEFKRTGTFGDCIIYRQPDKPDMYLLKQGFCEGTGRFYSGIKITPNESDPNEPKNS